ncbi:hypothetical protein [Lactobacillus helveticus]|uniref:hypothetical protein n=1 Tax=Lactobacillus helveticus TaxID=1587 RepID=UPI0013FD671B|nr:hypothetical protein [Lactobacillus helveticus]NHL94328.1 hypothetical protein [Lactobacillus helveticus]
MTNLDNLQDLIDQQAATEFDVKFDGDFDNADARIAYQALKNTPEFKKFRDVMVEQYTREITSKFLTSIEGIKDLIKQAGEE